MTADSKKQRSRKSVRVATTFTGAAACALAFAPAATAATAHGARPDQVDYSCPPGTGQWLHLAKAGGGEMCIADRTKLPQSVASVEITKFCGGNNSGFIYGSSVNGVLSPIQFKHGNFFAKIGSKAPYRVHSVVISKYGGTDHCGYPS